MVDLWRYRATSGEGNFIEQIKAPIFLEVLLAVEVMKKPLFNLEKKVYPSIIKDDFFSRIDPSIFTSIAQFSGNKKPEICKVTSFFTIFDSMYQPLKKLIIFDLMETNYIHKAI